MKTAQQAAQNWEQSAGRAAQAWQTGVQNGSDWSGPLLRQKGVMQTNWQAAVSSPRYDAAVQAAAATFKQDTIAKASNYSTGFSAGAQKQAAAIQKILSAEANIVASAPPRGTYEQNKARATYVMDQLHALKGTLGA